MGRLINMNSGGTSRAPRRTFGGGRLITTSRLGQGKPFTKSRNRKLGQYSKATIIKADTHGCTWSCPGCANDVWCPTEMCESGCCPSHPSDCPQQT